MGQIKNIKLHIVTDIKKNTHELTKDVTSRDVINQCTQWVRVPRKKVRRRTSRTAAEAE